MGWGERCPKGVAWQLVGVLCAMAGGLGDEWTHSRQMGWVALAIVRCRAPKEGAGQLEGVLAG